MIFKLGYHIVPKDPVNNLKFRKWIWEAGLADENFAKYVKEVCRQDILFYWNVFLWTSDPRKNPTVQPFITYDFQDDIILEMLDAIRAGEDRLGLKSRDMGFSWMTLGVFDHQYRFEHERIFLCISKKEDNVDLRGDESTLFAKLDYIEERLPSFLRIDGRERSLLRIRNPETRSVIIGESSNPNAGRSGRSTAVLRDEEAFCDNGLAIDKALADNTNCQLRVSTPNGTGNSYYLAYASNATKVIKAHWSLHPEKNPGLYLVTNRQVETLDKDFDYTDFPFIIDQGDGLRSPWYDKEVIRRASKIAVAQELDCDFQASGSQFFDSLTLQVLKQRDARRPFSVGTIRESETGNKQIFDDCGFGPLSLWIHLDAQGRVPLETTYCAGVDISAGTGASNSCCSIADVKTGEKVAEFTTDRLSPEAFADVVFLLLKAFSTPYGSTFVAYEGNGPGSIFAKRLLRVHGWTNYYTAVDETKPGAKRSKTKGRPGWWSNPTAKQQLLGDYRAALAGKQFINRCEAALNECEEYVFTAGGTVEHSRSRGNEDHAANADQHGDRVIADALCFLGVGKQVQSKGKARSIPRSSLAARRELRMAAMAKLGERKWH